MFNSLNIGTRLGLAFALVLGLLCAMAGTAAWQMGHLADNVDYYATNLVPSYQAQYAISNEVAEMRRNENRLVLAESLAELDATAVKIAEIRKKLDGQLQIYARELLSDDEDKADLAKVRSMLAAHYAELDKLTPMARAAFGDPAKAQAARRELISGSVDTYTAVQAAVKAWWDYNVKLDRKSTRLNSSHIPLSRMPSSA